MTKRPELLAPAGSLEAFFAALEAGADAVYCGLRDFSARARARNFTPQELDGMVRLAHDRDRRLYVTVNTLVKEAELPQLIDTLATLAELAVDGVILQDLAVWRLARQHFPELPLHASTQLTVHNAAGVRQLERMGFRRAVLARELTLAEIAAIRAATTLPLEHFIHGALCFSFSGQCYFSSWLGGKSGNRGRCAQPCRRRYQYRGKPGYFFSPNDLSAIDLLPELVRAGISSLKIEGRMKSAEYVANVVRAYRLALDAPAGRRREAVQEAKGLLRDAFGRPPTRGFLGGAEPRDIAVAALKGATGRFLGEVEQERQGGIVFTCRDRLHLGDRLRVQPKSDAAGTAFTIKELRLGSRGVKQAPAGSRVTVPSPFRNKFRKGDAIYKVSSEQAFTLSDAAARRRLAAAPPRRWPLALNLTLADDRLQLEAEAGGLSLSRDYPVTAYPAEGEGLTPEVLAKVFAASGDAPLRLSRLTADGLPPVVIPPSRLKEIRRELFRELGEQLRHDAGRRRRQRREEALAALHSAGPAAGGRRDVLLLAGNPKELRVLDQPGIDRLGLPLTPAVLPEPAVASRRFGALRERLVWDLPFILLGERWDWTRQAVQTLVAQGFRRFRCNNLGHLPLFDDLDGVELTSGYRCFSLNHQALLAWRELGIAEATLYVEDDRENLRALAGHGDLLPLNLVVHASLPLLVSRIRLRELRADTPVESERGEGYRVRHEDGLLVLRSAEDFSLIGRLRELATLGLHRYTVDLSHARTNDPTVRRILDGLRHDQPVPGTRSFNYLGTLE